MQPNEKKKKVNEEKKKPDVNKLKLYLMSAIVGCVALTIGLCVAVYFVTHQSTILKKKIVEHTESSIIQNAAIKKATDELDKSKTRLAGIKNQDDLLKRDIALYITATYRKVPKIVATSIATNIVNQAKKEDVSPELVVGIMQVESQFNPRAVGKKTKYGRARGLMQIMPEWAPKFGLDSKFDFHDIDTNIACGIKVFKIHLGEGKGNISTGLYLYVNKDKKYVIDVYTSMGKFVSFRSTVDDDEKTELETNIDDIDLVKKEAPKPKKVEKKAVKKVTKKVVKKVVKKTKTVKKIVKTKPMKQQ